jgi:hypothetical protein
MMSGRMVSGIACSIGVSIGPSVESSGGATMRQIAAESQ